jgi:hypothetical protein
MVKDEKTITAKTAVVKGFVKSARRPEKSLLPRHMKPAVSS